MPMVHKRDAKGFPASFSWGGVVVVTHTDKQTGGGVGLKMRKELRLVRC